MPGTPEERGFDPPRAPAGPVFPPQAPAPAPQAPVPPAPGPAPPPGAGLPPVPAPPGYGPPPFGSPPAPAGPPNGQAVASLILGILGLVFFFLCYFGLVFPVNLTCAVLAWVFGNKGLRAVEEGTTKEGQEMAKAGRVLGMVGTGLGVLAVVGWTTLFVILAATGELNSSR